MRRPDVVRVEGLALEAEVGVYAHEHGVRQRLDIDLSVETDLRLAARSDDVRDAIDYDHLAQLARDVVGARHHALIESIAEELAHRILDGFSARASAVWVRVAKPGAVPGARTVAVEVHRTREPHG